MSSSSALHQSLPSSGTSVNADIRDKDTSSTEGLYALLKVDNDGQETLSASDGQDFTMMLTDHVLYTGRPDALSKQHVAICKWMVSGDAQPRMTQVDPTPEGHNLRSVRSELKNFRIRVAKCKTAPSRKSALFPMKDYLEHLEKNSQSDTAKRLGSIISQCSASQKPTMVATQHPNLRHSQVDSEPETNRGRAEIREDEILQGTRSTKAGSATTQHSKTDTDTLPDAVDEVALQRDMNDLID